MTRATSAGQPGQAPGPASGHGRPDRRAGSRTSPASGDFANTIGQVFAVRGLLEAGEPGRPVGAEVPAPAAVRQRLLPAELQRRQDRRRPGLRQGRPGRHRRHRARRGRAGLRGRRATHGSKKLWRRPPAGSSGTRSTNGSFGGGPRRRPPTPTAPGWRGGPSWPRAVRRRARRRRAGWPSSRSTGNVCRDAAGRRARRDRLRPTPTMKAAKQDGIDQDDARPVAPGHGPGGPGAARLSRCTA